MRQHVKTPKRHYLRDSFPNSGSSNTLALLLERQQKIEIGQRIKWLRDNSAETSRTIARHVDVSDEAVRNWIAGKGISVENSEKVAEMFDLDWNWLWRGEGTAPEGYPQEQRKPTPNPLRGPYAEQLDRIEEKLDEILERLTTPDKDEGDGPLPKTPPTPPTPPPKPQDGRAPRPRPAKRRRAS